MIVERVSPLPFPAEAVWAWHTRPGAFSRLTPPWERVQVRARTGGIENGARVTLDVGLGPVPVRWVAEHRDVVPGRQFVDVQVSGPFSRWTHLHAFEPAGDGACLVRDRIEYALPGGAVGSFVGGAHVRRKLEDLLRYRHDTLLGDLQTHHGVAPRNFVITGATGLIGSALVPFLTTGGHRVTRLVRLRRHGNRPGGTDAIRDAVWSPEAGIVPPDAVASSDVVIHLAAPNIAGARWTPDRKRLLLESRVQGTALLARTMAASSQTSAALVSVSAVGIYGDRGDEVLNDEASPGAGFLAQMAQAWEQAAEPARAAGIRTVHPRLGIVLSPAGGALQRLLPPFRLGVGGPLGSGRQWMSFASIDDVLGMLYRAALEPGLKGAFNAVAPEPVTNASFARALGRVLHRPAALPVPAAALKGLFGEMAETALLSSQRVVPDRLVREGYSYRHPTVTASLSHVLGGVA